MAQEGGVVGGWCGSLLHCVHCTVFPRLEVAEIS